MVKVLHILWSGGIGGTEEYITSLVKYFNYSRYKMRLCFISQKGPIFEEIEKTSENIDFIGMKSGLDIIGASRLFAYLRKQKFDIIHSHSANILSTVVISFFRRPKKIFTEHVSPGAKSFSWKRKLFFKLFSDSFQTIIAISRYVESKLVEDMKVDSSKITVIHNGIRIDKYDHILPAKDLLHLRKNDATILGFISRMEDFKRPDLFISIAHEIIKKKRDFHFIMVGDGPELVRCKKMISHYAISGYFDILGFRRDVPSILKLLDALIFLSKGEGFGIVTLEAMAMGVPVFALCDGAIPEIINHRENGVLLDTADPESMAQQIISYLGEASLLGKIRKKAAEDARSKFTLDLCAEKIDRLYAKVLRSRCEEIGEGILE